MRLWFAAFWIALAFGCKKREPPLVLAVDPVSEADAKALGEKLVAVAKPCDPRRLSPLIDHQALAAKFANTSKLPNAQRTGRALMKEQTASQILCGWLRGVTEYKLLRVKMVGSEPHPIMRRMMRDARSGITAIGYDELQLGTTKKDRQVRLYDVFFYVQGQWLTQVLGGNSPDSFIEQPQAAEAVRKAMASLGVAEGQMEAVSLGEEKPKAMGSGEAAWAENRRADIVY